MKINTDMVTVPELVTLFALREQLRSMEDKPVKINLQLIRMIMADIDKKITRAGRLAFLSWVFEREIKSSAELLVTQLAGIYQWAMPRKIGSEWTYSTSFFADLSLINRVLNKTSEDEEIVHAVQPVS